MSFFKASQLNAAIAPPPPPRHKILLVDDEAANLTVLASLLGPHYQILQAQSGQEAMQLVDALPEGEQISLLLTDQRMPGMTGVELCQQLQLQSPDTIRLIITGFIDVNAIIDAINQAGIYKFIVKPFGGEDLKLTLTRAVEAYELRQELQQYVSQLEAKVRQRTAELEQQHQQLLEAYQRIEQLSLHDTLTGLGNRRYWQQRADLRFHAMHAPQTERRQEQLKLQCIMLFDIDHFKSINDQYGHDVGDQVLAAFAAMLRQQCRESDVLARWGGEEFVVMAEVASDTQATALTERILQACRDIRINTLASLQFTTSAGVVIYPFGLNGSPAGAAWDWQQLLTLADRALYSAKQQGRDRWIRAEPEAPHTPDPQQPLRLSHC